MRPGAVVSDVFLVESQVATGGMGLVFRGRDQRTGAPVAIKILRPDGDGHGGRGASDGQRFAREAALLSQLPHHPGIARYIAHGTTAAGELYLVSEWVSGRTLSLVLEERGLDAGEAVEVVARVAEALAVAHKAGVVHRDIKPDNLLFLSGGDLQEIKIIDFGIALRREDPQRLTRTGAMLGTPGYMAPEQARAARDVDARADVFALGCVLFECLTGRRVFTGHNLMAVRTKTLFTEPPSLRTLSPDLFEAQASAQAAALERLVQRMLAKDPAGRPCDGAAVAAELGALAIEKGGTRRSRPSAEPPTWAFAHSASGRRPRSLTFTPPAQTPIVCLVLAQVAETTTVTSSSAVEWERLAQGAIEDHGGGHVEILDDGALAIIVAGPAGTGTAREGASRAARCALSLRGVFPGAAVVLTSSVGAQDFAGVLDGLIDWAVRALELELADAALDSVDGALPIRVDAGTADLLKEDFVISLGLRGRHVLVGELSR